MSIGVVRPATPADVDGLARCHVQCWREAYAHLLSEEFLTRLTVEGRREVWQRVLSDDHQQAYVAEADGETVGFSGTRPGGDGPCDVELWGLYVLEKYHGSGLGQRLLDAAVGDGPAYLRVAEDNPRARAFYSRNGFRPDGHRDVEERWENMVVIRMVR